MNTKTQELFYKNQKMAEFEATVLNCQKSGEFHEIYLDKTAFYPEGGGQPGDTGFLNNIEIIDTIIKSGDIAHISKEAISENTPILGKIDFKRRFRFMQSHAGEHMLSGALNKLYDCDNVGFHIGSDFVTIDINQKLTEEQIKEAEMLANRAIYKNLPINISYHSFEELKNIKYRSKKELDGEIRIVTIPDIDTCACCGIHCTTTGEVGMVKIITSQSYKGGTRIFFLCGEDALNDYTAKNNDIYRISVALSVKPTEAGEALVKLKDDLNNTKYELALAKEEILKLKSERFEENSNIVFEFEENLSTTEISKYALLLSAKCNIAFVFSKDSEDTYRYAISSTSQDVREICKELNSSLNGKGGGKKELAQGGVSATREKIEEWRKFYEKR